MSETIRPDNILNHDENQFVYPLCSKMQHNRFFENFSIFLLIFFVLSFNFGISILVFSFYISGYFCMIYSFIAFIWVMQCLFTYKNTKQYGGTSSYTFALFLFISMLLAIGFFFCFMVDEVISDVHHIYYFKNISHMTFYIVTFGIFTPLLCYFSYLSILLYFVVYKEHLRIQKSMITSQEKYQIKDEEDNENLL